MVTLVQDTRYALRTLRRRPAYTVVSAVTLALGIGATAAIFGVVDGMLFRPLRYPNPEQIVVVTMTRGTSLREPVAYPDFSRLAGTIAIISVARGVPMAERESDRPRDARTIGRQFHVGEPLLRCSEPSRSPAGCSRTRRPRSRRPVRLPS